MFRKKNLNISKVFTEYSRGSILAFVFFQACAKMEKFLLIKKLWPELTISGPFEHLHLSDLSGPFEEIIAAVLLGTVTSNNFRICIEDQRESGKSVKMRKHSYL